MSAFWDRVCPGLDFRIWHIASDLGWWVWDHFDREMSRASLVLSPFRPSIRLYRSRHAVLVLADDRQGRETVCSPVNSGHEAVLERQRLTPIVWSGRASQEGSSSWLRGLAQMYPASDWSSVLRAIMDISARAI
jgi:hypothetical protein